ncbi:MAG: 16S rRNA (cytidine(1402)-2'-O)-methyltransferase [Acidobacteria bacterium]|nr:MAG: 16S rRNA (cytidine(1402)-2'-O)-methyltransferase [Acidobacteriota bacterium]
MPGIEPDLVERGRLFVVATPIGNLGDLSPRAVEVLSDADLIVAEDTRRTRKLLSHARISTKMISCHRDNESARLDGLLSRLEGGEALALVSDAGVPLISDPGALLVRACIDREIPVECIPGPSAITSALVVSGLPVDRFTFEGFLPRAQKARRSRLEGLAGEERTMVFFEAPHRMKAMLTDAALVLGATRQCAICRELTKIHEEVWRCSLREAAERFASVEPRGEYVVVIEGATPSDAEAHEVEAAAREAIALALETGATPREAAAAGEVAGLSRSSAYKLAVSIARQDSRGDRR